ncbi:MAG: hypothetical protein CVU14_02725 [Bacteroidetes bacterium HGW-Bacteroidetes-9]|nr:MAG: hypothetical protein CVU14_02725 [Bacteroidetes bacterium HGW-Bacteroidetes-9]
MKTFSVVAFLLVFAGSIANAQVNRCSYVPPRQADNWLFYQNAGLKFTDAGVTVNHPSASNLPAGKGVAAISDEDGNLILYTDGLRVWNSSDVGINYGPNLSGDLGSTQSSLVVPMPGSSSVFFIFTTDIIYPPAFGQTKGFNYSKVDMTINSPNGGVTAERDIKLLNESSEMITGVRHGNGIDYWVVSHGLSNNRFYSYLVESAGVDETPVESNVGSILSNDYDLREYLGAMKISPKGDKIAYASFGKGTVELFSFNNQTGAVGNAMTLNPPVTGTSQGPYYVEFSPDGTKLYLTVADLTTGRDNHLYQYDITAGVMTEINVAPLDADVSALQLGRDGKIYVSRYQRTWLGVIENPNRPGIACNYLQDGIDLGAKRVLNGLPNFIQSFFDVPPIDYDTKCDGDLTVFSMLNTSNIDNVTWNFNDPGNPAPGSGTNPVHQFSTHGDYLISLTETFNGQNFVTTFPVHIDSLPLKTGDKPLPDSLYIFPGSTIPLYGPDDMYSYLWQDGSINQSFNVSEEGLYHVEYVDINCCRNADSIKVTALNISVPNAFTPNGDNLNDVFRALGPNDGIEDFSLAVYSRFGQLLWETTTFEDFWDGTYNGELLPRGNYAWSLAFNVKGNVMEIGKVKYKGSVLLLR